MILAGDVGGTKSNLALFELENGRLVARFEKTLPSHKFASLSDLLKEFLSTTDLRADFSCLSIAGPVKNRRCQTPNLPWIVEADEVERTTGLRRLELINDLEANARGLSVLGPEDFAVINEGDGDAVGNAAVISAGTGLGEAGLYWDGTQHLPFASEGGHGNFGPNDALQIELLEYMLKVHNHVSYERVLSGPGLFNIYSFMRDTGKFPEPDWLKEELKISDPAATISKNAMNGKSEICTEALKMFVTIYGSEAGNLAMKVMAVGGVYLGGGIAPKIIKKLQEPLFMQSFTNKGRMKALLQAIPVKVILNDKTALLGAADLALQLANKSVSA
jgi:glucokinase